VKAAATGYTHRQKGNGGMQAHWEVEVYNKQNHREMEICKQPQGNGDMQANSLCCLNISIC